MNVPIVSRSFPITLIGAGQLGTSDLKDALSHAPDVVAADGGVQAALAAELTPLAIIGDLDSAVVPDPDRHLLHFVDDQNTTDFDKALAAVDAPLILAVGFGGGRLDHALANFSALARAPHRRTIIVTECDVAFLCPPEIALPLINGDRVSLYPLAQVRVDGTGLVWPLERLLLDPLGRLGTSNAATGPVTVAVDVPALLVILPRERLGLAISALQACHHCWPAP